MVTRMLCLAGLAWLIACAGKTSSSGPGPATEDTYLPWEGGSSYYAKWTNGPPSDPSFFPIAVWLQSPGNAAAYKAIGINLFVGLWDGPTAEQLQGLAQAAMPALCSQNTDFANDKTILGWTHQDEPDNAQSDGSGGYGPCIPPADIVTGYQAMVQADPTRPVYLNLGQGVANDDWVGRGSECSAPDRGLLDYPKYVEGADVVSFDIYPVNSTSAAVHGNLWLVAKGIDRLRQWAEYKKPVWNWIETTDYDGTGNRPTLAEVKAEVWMSLIHGSLGIGYFVHVFAPGFIEAGLLADNEMKNAVKEINSQIHDLAPALNTPSLKDAVTVSSSDPDVPVDVMVKRQGGAIYLFAVAMRPGPTRATFTLSSRSSGTAEALGESRNIAVSSGSFSDDFETYAVHLYRIAP